ncbi:CDGSH iron-sulfur domain-containing protein 1 [Armadillidium nasatum]|uniref:CDGSH iron-sulfur domain-containing protein 1 n=1 Tax=Armadillidium nasatum TaxID=96803 RepID=A0A5N5SKX3_9CRUS|nr:CDGSH iron-sulfur domain-containing protein 1 [Armadillidium nasatum]
MLKGGHCNLSVKKNESKVVDSIDMEDLGDKASFCRCWRSAKFPYCDGTHGKHNTTTGDNVGPLVIKKKELSCSSVKSDIPSWSSRVNGCAICLSHGRDI